MAAVTPDGADKTSPPNSADSARIGWAFLSQYYSFLNKDPARLHCFYTKRSTLIHSTEGDEPVPCYGQQEIHAKIMSLAFEDCKVYISNVDSQSSAEGGIIVQVIGEISNAGGAWRKFAQTFFLAEQPNGYFVLNDICRYLKEEGDEAEAPAVAAPTQDAQPEEVQQPEPTPDAEPASVQSVLFDEAPAASSSFQEPTATPDAAPAVPEEPVSADASNDSFTFHGDNSLLAPTSNGVAHDEIPATVESEPVVEEAAPEPTATEPEPQPEPVAVEEKPAAAPEPVEETPAPAPAAAAPESAAPAPSAPAASAPAAPKSWASLAASNVTKWGQISNQSKGVSSVAPPVPSPAAERAPAPAAAPAPAGPPLVDAVLAITTSSCFVKGVVETVSDKALRDVLTSRFGPLKEVDIVRSKACAFVEFEKLEHARRAIQASLRPSEGGEGGIHIDVGTGMPARINIVERKPHGERPNPGRRNQEGADQRGSGGAPTRGRGGAAGVRGGGGRGGRGGPKGGAPAAAK
ncbi:hypothetical protein JCM8547_009058 [Rhodosporidiobolus lusitaniae]